MKKKKGRQSGGRIGDKNPIGLFLASRVARWVFFSTTIVEEKEVDEK
jgi:hypothetical protein